jgi:hypothetical protein
MTNPEQFECVKYAISIGKHRPNDWVL